MSLRATHALVIADKITRPLPAAEMLEATEQAGELGELGGKSEAV